MIEENIVYIPPMGRSKIEYASLMATFYLPWTERYPSGFTFAVGGLWMLNFSFILFSLRLQPEWKRQYEGDQILQAVCLG